MKSYPEFDRKMIFLVQKIQDQKNGTFLEFDFSG